MASVHVSIEQRPGRPKRYVVRMRAGGREAKIRHLGSFPSRKLADSCADWARMELANGRVPDRKAMLRAADPAETPTVARAVADWLASRIDLAASSRTTYDAQVRHITEHRIGGEDVRSVTPAMVQALISEMAAKGYSRSTISGAKGHLVGALDHAGVDPNPAQHPRIRLPRDDSGIIEPPAYDDVVAVLDVIAAKYVLPIALLEASGVRIGEALSLRPEDVDREGARIRVAVQARGKTAAARRFLPCPAEVCELLPREAPIFDITDAGLRSAIRSACLKLGIELFSPHDLRHRWAARQVQQGVPITVVAQQIGHKRPSLTTDVYAVALTDLKEAWRHAVQLSAAASTLTTASRLT